MRALLFCLFLAWSLLPAPAASPQTPEKKKKPASAQKKKMPPPKTPQQRSASRDVNPKALDSKTKLEWNIVRMRAPDPGLRIIREGTPPRNSPFQRARPAGSDDSQKVLENRGVVMQLEDGWRLRLSVDSRAPSTLGDRPTDPDLMGLDTVGPTVTWERKF